MGGKSRLMVAVLAPVAIVCAGLVAASSVLSRAPQKLLFSSTGIEAKYSFSEYDAAFKTDCVNAWTATHNRIRSKTNMINDAKIPELCDAYLARYKKHWTPWKNDVLPWPSMENYMSLRVWCTSDTRDASYINENEWFGPHDEAEYKDCKKWRQWRQFWS